MNTGRTLTGIVFVLLGLVAAASLAVCGEAAAQEVSGADQAPEPASATVPVGPRDPFVPLVMKGGPPAERRPLSGLRLAGLIWDSSATTQEIRALVETPDGLGYIVRLDDRRFGGQVIAIGRDRVRFSVIDEAAGQSRVQLIDLKLDGAGPTIARTSDSP